MVPFLAWDIYKTACNQLSMPSNLQLTEEIVKTWRLKISKIADMHLEFERAFEDFNHIVPYKYNWGIKEQIFSPDLYSLLQVINSASRNAPFPKLDDLCIKILSRLQKTSI